MMADVCSVPDGKGLEGNLVLMVTMLDGYQWKPNYHTSCLRSEDVCHDILVVNWSTVLITCIKRLGRWGVRAWNHATMNKISRECIQLVKALVRQQHLTEGFVVV